MTRRRKPDSWSDIQGGDIVSFDTTSTKCPTSTYVHRVSLREDGKRVLLGTFGEDIVEHTSYRMRLDQRSLTVRLQDEGVIDPMAHWQVIMTFDWAGRAAPSIRIERMPLPQFVGLRWDTASPTAEPDAALLLVLWGAPVEFPPPGEKYKAREHLMRYTAQGLELLPRDHQVNDSEGYPSFATGAPEPWDSLFATPVRLIGHFADQPTPTALETVTNIATWVQEHRAELQDPAHR